MRNGVFWRSASLEVRYAYVAGLVDAQQFTGNYIGCNCSWVEMVDGIAAFYDSDASYLRLPVQVALDVVTFRKRGVSNEQIGQYLDAALRPPRREGELSSQPAPAPLKLSSFVLNDVGYMRDNSVFGCKGTLRVDSTALKWSSGPKCGDDFEIPVMLNDLAKIEFGEAALGVNVWLSTTAVENAVHLSMSSQRAQRLSRHIFAARPVVQQQCFLVKGFGSTREQSPFDCKAW